MNSCIPYAFRLKPGEDLKKAIQNLVYEKQIKAAALILNSKEKTTEPLTGWNYK